MGALYRSLVLPKPELNIGLLLLVNDVYYVKQLTSEVKQCAITNNLLKVQKSSSWTFTRQNASLVLAAVFTLRVLLISDI